MNAAKQQFLNTIRSNSAYPVYRGFIGTIALLGYLLAALAGGGSMIFGLTFMSQSFMGGLAILVAGGIVAALIFLLTRFYKEAALILVDIGDCVADASLRSQFGTASANVQAAG